MAAAESVRPPGVATGTGAAIAAAEAYRRTIGSFDNLLTWLGEDEWRRPVLRGLDIQFLIGHLIGVERQLHAAVGIASALATSTDHVASTQGDALAQVGPPPGGDPGGVAGSDRADVGVGRGCRHRRQPAPGQPARLHRFLGADARGTGIRDLDPLRRTSTGPPPLPTPPVCAS